MTRKIKLKWFTTQIVRDAFVQKKCSICNGSGRLMVGILPYSLDATRMFCPYCTDVLKLEQYNSNTKQWELVSTSYNE